MGRTLRPLADIPIDAQTRTLCFPIRERRVLLGFKKHGVGTGKYLGFGGKVEAGESILEGAIRELREEAGLSVDPGEMQHVAQVDFQFPAKPTWSMLVQVFVVRHWRGDPSESGEMRPEWFDFDALPFGQMWPDAPHWIPRVLDGETVSMRFFYNDDNATLKSVVE